MRYEPTVSANKRYTPRERMLAREAIADVSGACWALKGSRTSAEFSYSVCCGSGSCPASGRMYSCRPAHDARVRLVRKGSVLNPVEVPETVSLYPRLDSRALLRSGSGDYNGQVTAGGRTSSRIRIREDLSRLIISAS